MAPYIQGQDDHYLPSCGIPLPACLCSLDQEEDGSTPGVMVSDNNAAAAAGAAAAAAANSVGDLLDMSDASPVPGPLAVVTGHAVAAPAVTSTAARGLDDLLGGLDLGVLCSVRAASLAINEHANNNLA